MTVVCLKEFPTGGYHRKILRVDLSKMILTEESIHPKILYQFIGGTGLGIRLLYDEIAPGKSRIAVIGFMEKNDQLPYNFPSTCKQCADAPCLSACPVNAVFQTKDKLKKIGIDYETCIGCGTCVRACPFGAMLFDQKKRAPFKCELCDGDPACAAICPTEAIVFVQQKPFYSKVPSLQMKGFSILHKRNTAHIRKRKSRA